MSPRHFEKPTLSFSMAWHLKLDSPVHNKNLFECVSERFPRRSRCSFELQRIPDKKWISNLNRFQSGSARDDEKLIFNARCQCIHDIFPFIWCCKGECCIQQLLMISSFQIDCFRLTGTRVAIFYISILYRRKIECSWIFCFLFQ